MVDLNRLGIRWIAYWLNHYKERKKMLQNRDAIIDQFIYESRVTMQSPSHPLTQEEDGSDYATMNSRYLEESSHHLDDEEVQSSRFYAMDNQKTTLDYSKSKNSEVKESLDETEMCETFSFDNILDNLMKKSEVLLSQESQNSSQTDQQERGVHPFQVNKLLIAMSDQEIENLHQVLRQKVAANMLKERSYERKLLPIPRRKHMDGRASIRNLTRTAGVFTGFCYRKSPTIVKEQIQPMHVLFLGDVSGSMGRYVSMVLYFISALEQLGHIDSYVFSDTATYVTPFIKKGDSFRAQYDRLRQEAHSWEYGTKLSTALQTVLQEKRYHQNTIIILLTDGGFSLTSGDWQDTQILLSELTSQTAKLFLATPNMNLIQDIESVHEFHRVKRLTSTDLETPWLQKIARFGLLKSYSDEIILCQQQTDIIHLIKLLS